MTNDHGFWEEKWQQGDIEFHKGDVNPVLLEHYAALDVEIGDQVLVPLCGKSLDMKWLLDQGYDVTGVELTEIAIKTFFEEQDLVYDCYEDSGFQVYEGDHLKLLQGDIFNLDINVTGECQAYYDRAALIALPAAVRQRYVDCIAAVLEPEAKGVVSVIDYQHADEIGPPFNISPEAFKKLYKKFDVTLLAETPGGKPPKRLRDKGVDFVHEYVYQVTKR